MKCVGIGSFLVASSLCASALAHPRGGGDYHVEDVTTSTPDAGLVRTDFVVQQGATSFDRFHVVRVQQACGSRPEAPPVILLSPFGFPARYWELTKLASYRDSFAARLSLAGYDVWLVDSRLADVSPGGCESGAADCSPMSDWGIDTAVDDAMFVRDMVRWAHPGPQPVLGGFSGGSSTAIAAVNREPHAFAGLLMWEGTLYTPDPAIRARNAAFCQQDEARLSAGVFYDASVQGFRTIFDLAASAPSAPSPIPVFPPGTTNLQAMIFALSVPDPTNPLNFTDTFVRLVGDPATSSLTYSDIDRVFQLAPLVGNYAPVRFIRDSHCALGGSDTEFTNNLGAYHGDVLVYAEGHGFGQMMIDTANLMTHAHVTVDFHPELAESDPYFHVDWVHVSVDPLLGWLQSGRSRGR